MSPEESKPDEMVLFEGLVESKMLAVGAMLSALYVVCAFVPFTPFIGSGGPGPSLTLAIFVAPLFGVLLGPVRGGLFGLIGGLLAAFVSPLYLLVPTIMLGPAVSGFFTGLVLHRHTRVGRMSLPGPLTTAFYLVIVIVLYLIPNYTAWWFMAPYALAAVAAAALQTIESRSLTGVSRVRALLRVLPLALIGTITDFSMMTMGAVYILGLPPEAFGMAIFPLMLFERTAATIGSAIAAQVVMSVFPDLFHR
ncbi:MAG: ECF transporter S component [Candidatus Thorarchaeota archaeon]|nr:ECF transporter S component [Candidatus Thorarchaeota archaeon]